MSRKFVLSRFQRWLLGSLKAVPGEDGRLFKRLPINQSGILVETGYRKAIWAELLGPINKSAEWNESNH
jgi:hypothetical protein